MFNVLYPLDKKLIISASSGKDEAWKSLTITVPSYYRKKSLLITNILIFKIIKFSFTDGKIKFG
jgi:hypothetical protein